MPLLPGVLLRRLQLHGQPGAGHRPDQRGDRLPHLEIHGPVLDLEDGVVGELPVQRNEMVVRGPCPVRRAVPPVLVVVVDEGPPVDRTAVRRERGGEHVRAVRVTAAVRERARLSLGVGLHHEPAEVGDRRVHPGGRPGPPRPHRLLQRIRARQPAQYDRRGEGDRQMRPDAVRPQRARDVRHFTDPVGQQPCVGRVHVDVVDGHGVDPAGRQQPAIGPHPLQVPTRPPVLPEQ